MATRSEADALKIKKRLEAANEVPVIQSFMGDKRWLSNFAIEPSGLSNEHYYQACKGAHGSAFERVEQVLKEAGDILAGDFRFTENSDYEPTWSEYVLLSPTPGVAKKRGKYEVPMNEDQKEDWASIQVEVMHYLLQRKFKISDFREKLLATGDAILIEGNTWGDTFWGVCKGVGDNNLGRLLMKVRNEIRTGEATCFG